MTTQPVQPLTDEEALDKSGNEWLECVKAIQKRSAEVGATWTEGRAGALLAILAQAGYTFIKFDDLSDDGITPKACLATIESAEAEVARLREALKPFANIMPVDSPNLHAKDAVQVWVKDGADVKIICGGVCVGHFWNATNAILDRTATKAALSPQKEPQA